MVRIFLMLYEQVLILSSIGRRLKHPFQRDPRFRILRKWERITFNMTNKYPRISIDTVAAESRCESGELARNFRRKLGDICYLDCCITPREFAHDQMTQNEAPTKYVTLLATRQVGTEMSASSLRHYHSLSFVNVPTCLIRMLSEECKR